MMQLHALRDIYVSDQEVKYFTIIIIIFHYYYYHPDLDSNIYIYIYAVISLLKEARIPLP